MNREKSEQPSVCYDKIRKKLRFEKRKIVRLRLHKTISKPIERNQLTAPLITKRMSAPVFRNFVPSRKSSLMCGKTAGSSSKARWRETVFSWKKPQERATATAVSYTSPVKIYTRIPAFIRNLIVSGTFWKPDVCKIKLFISKSSTYKV